MIVIAAIFGTSILRDFQRDTYQMIFTKPISKFAYLGGRWAGSFVTTVFAFSGLIFGSWLGTFAPWADHVRIGPNHLWWYLQPFLSIMVVQIFFLGSLFFARGRAFPQNFCRVYPGRRAVHALFDRDNGIQCYAVARTVLERNFRPGRILLFRRHHSLLDCRGEKLCCSRGLRTWPRGVFLYNRLIWLSVGASPLAAVWVLFPMSVEALTAKSQGRRAAKAKLQDEIEARPKRSLVAAHASYCSPGVRARDHLDAIPLSHADADDHDPPRDPLLGAGRSG